ncbi:MAG: UDP-N-acetylmuramoyl-tripeptide--D-alanyl-D-alanine ligase, partial [Flavobacteriaceae bacterium]
IRSGLFFIFVLMTIDRLHQLYMQYPVACTDTRQIKQACLFFALKGDNFDGNKFAAEALSKGAEYAIVDNAAYANSEKTILVDSVLETLQQLATYHRNQCSARIIGLTGSNGKTTTKELMAAVLSKKYRTVATRGNLNNHIGVPLTLLRIQKDTELAIIEMGANHLEEIAFLCELAQPEYGYITNFGKAHLEGFGSEEGVIKGKSELYEYLLSHQKHVFLNADDPIQEARLSTYVKKIGFSTAKDNYYLIRFLGAHPFVAMEVEGLKIQTQLIGSYNFSNCCAAVLMGKYFNVPINEIKEALEYYVPENNRSQVIEKHGHRIILDAYNANPTSMRAALENFEQLRGSEKIVFLGDMFELGRQSEKEHQDTADLVENMKFSDAYLIGEGFGKTQSSLKRYRTFEALSDYLKEHPLAPSQILIKGSRGMALERILELL